MYDPRAAYFNRMTSSAKTGRNSRKSHQYTNSIGGCSSNYNAWKGEKYRDKF